MAAGWVISTYVISLIPMHGNNMYPAIRDGDLCVLYRIGGIRQGDVVIYEYGGEQKLARVAAVEGSTVTMGEDGSFMIDGFVPAEEIFYPTMAGAKGDTVEIQEGEVFLLNDYRTEQGDSRDIGCVKVKDLKGKVLFLFRRRGI